MTYKGKKKVGKKTYHIIVLKKQGYSFTSKELTKAHNRFMKQSRIHGWKRP